MKVPYKTLKFLGVRYYTDGKTVSEQRTIETAYRCGHGRYLKWYMVAAVNLGLARIVIHGKETKLRITPLGQQTYLQWVERLAECSPETFEFGGFAPVEKARYDPPAIERRKRRL